jgi:predicted metal-dependent peptidase
MARKCSICREEGHDKRKCPNEECAVCQEKGHNAEACPVVKEVTEKRNAGVEARQKMINASKDYNIDYDIVGLLHDEPFFAIISLAVDKTPSYSIPTAGVRVNPHTGYFEMLYNPAFLKSLPKKHLKGVLKHEFFHLILEHVTGRNMARDKPELAKKWNFAADLAINSFLDGELPDSCLKAGPGGSHPHLPTLQSSEWYFANLTDEDVNPACKTCGGSGEVDDEGEESGSGGSGEGEEGEGEGSGGSSCSGEEGKEKGSGCGSGGKKPCPNCDGQQMDDHSMWGDDGSEDAQARREIANGRLKGVFERAVAEASKKGWGSVPGDMQAKIIASLSNTVDWRAVLRYFVKQSKRASKRSTVRRINKRYPLVHPGKKVERLANIAISIDQSGSVDDDMLVKFFSELMSLSKLATFTVIPFDTRVDENLVYEWKKGTSKPCERVMCGGTDFDAPTKYVNESKKFDGHIILTDMRAPKPKRSLVNRMWMTTPECKSSMPFSTNERVIGIK